MPSWAYPVCPEVNSVKIHRGPVLNILNSLTRTKVPFQTSTFDNSVKWYMCGPTVYDSSHMGHARTYLGFDIIRRVMENYFGYNVSLVMNITDIDDKIINRSNERGIPFTELARHWEVEFLKDMDELGVVPPNVMTRVSEYMDEIMAYIQRIIDKGYAYESNGSVYFSVMKFHEAPMHCYCKLVPTGMNNAELLAEGEGGAVEFASEKKAANDFALWKKSKEGEPSWDSPWGKGRPGWHIECSVMASDVFKKMGDPTGKMDIHSGGVDLKFPHHDNEMAQAEAESGSSQWVNYFVHAGHLSIKGFKMSKSLKNFITIQQALKQNTARQIRFCFLRHNYDAPMDYGDQTMSLAMDMESIFVKYFANVKAVLRAVDKDDSAKWGEEEKVFGNEVNACKAKVHEALCDNFDTPTVMSELQALVGASNRYLEKKEVNKTKPVALVVRTAAAYITNIFKVFGLIGNGEEIGWSVGGGEGGASKEDLMAPILDAVLDFRSGVRDAARTGDTKKILELCDRLRDVQLMDLGVQLEDKEGGRGVWKLADAEEMKRDREQKESEKKRKEEEKRKRAEEAEAKRRADLVPPEEFMKNLTLEDGVTKAYSKFGDDGLPTHDSKGEELVKSGVKKAQKLFAGQKKKYEKASKK